VKQLGLFAKYWRPGAVKTRLAASLGAPIASQIYFGFLTTLMCRLQDAGDQRQVVYTPQADRLAFERLVETMPWSLAPQSAGDLGTRLSHWFSTTAGTDPDGMVVIGSDSPNLPLDLVSEAFHRLSQHEIVIGPTEDGGYYLLGMRSFHASLFSGIEWSTDQVFAQTMQRIASLSAKCHVLRTWYDVDTLADLRRLYADLGREQAEADVELARLRSIVRPFLT